MKGTVLVVDDARLMRAMLKDILVKEEYEVIGEADNGREAVEKYRELRPDLVTMDIVMPEMDGITAVKEILKIDRKAKVIVVSAVDQQILIIRAIKAGAKDYILKPLNPVEISRVMQLALEDEEGPAVEMTGIYLSAIDNITKYVSGPLSEVINLQIKDAIENFAKIYSEYFDVDVSRIIIEPKEDVKLEHIREPLNFLINDIKSRFEEIMGEAGTGIIREAMTFVYIRKKESIERLGVTLPEWLRGELSLIDYIIGQVKESE